MVDDADLVGDLGAAENGHKGVLGGLDHAGDGLDLASEQQAGVGGQQRGDAHHRRVGPVGRTEGVVHVDLAETGELGGELGVVLLLALVETQVLDDEHLAVGQGLGGRNGIVAADILHVGDGLAQQLREARGDRGHGVGLFVAGARRTTEVAHGDYAAPPLGQEPQGGQGGPDTGVVGHDAVGDRDVEVHADDDAFALDVGVGDAPLARHCSPHS